jgi:sugar lactone lactonase YvrE
MPGKGIQEWLGDPRLVWPDSIAFDPEGTLYVTTSEIQFCTNPPRPYGIYSAKTTTESP